MRVYVLIDALADRGDEIVGVCLSKEAAARRLATYCERFPSRRKGVVARPFDVEETAAFTFNAGLAGEIERLAEGCTPAPWRRNRRAETDEDYLTGPEGQCLIRRDARLMELLRNSLPAILAALLQPQETDHG